MSPEREMLERAERFFQPPDEAFASLARRRARRDRNRRLTSAAIASALAAVAIWVAFHGLAGSHVRMPQPGIERHEQLGPETVARLRYEWLGTVGPVNSSPVVAGGRVYFGGADGNLYVFPVRCQTGGRVCSPLWIGHTGGLDSGVPVVSGGTVYVGSNDGRLYAFPTSCGSAGATCQPRWTFPTGSSLGYSSPVLVGGIVYVATDKLWAIDASTGALRWSAPFDIPAALSPTPDVWGFTMVLSTHGLLAAFSLTCGAHGGHCSPLWIAHPPSSNTQPVVVGGVVYQSAGANLFAYPVSCGAGGATCEPSWIGHAPGRVTGPPTVADGLVYVGSRDGSLSAFAVGCGSEGSACQPVASRSRMACECFNSNVIVTGGVLYMITDAVTAYPESCALEPTCRPLFKAGPYQSNTGAAITTDGVYVATNTFGGHLYAFELPRRPTSHATASSGGIGTAAVAILVYVGLGALVVRAGLRRVRRRRLVKGAPVEPIV